MTNGANQMTTKKTLGVTRNFAIVVMGIFLCGLLSAAPGYIPKSVDINKADTTVFIALPGIGSKLAAGIVRFRDQLHGFYSIEQVAEICGMRDSTFQKIRPWLFVSDSFIQKININTATIEDLKTPYINYNLANAIYQFRIQHGKFARLEDLRRIMLIDETVYKKIVPYLTTG